MEQSADEKKKVRQQSLNLMIRVYIGETLRGRYGLPVSVNHKESIKDFIIRCNMKSNKDKTDEKGKKDDSNGNTVVKDNAFLVSEKQVKALEKKLMKMPSQYGVDDWLNMMDNGSVFYMGNCQYLTIQQLNKYITECTDVTMKDYMNILLRFIKYSVSSSAFFNVSECQPGINQESPDVYDTYNDITIKDTMRKLWKLLAERIRTYNQLPKSSKSPKSIGSIEICDACVAIFSMLCYFPEISDPLYSIQCITTQNDDLKESDVLLYTFLNKQVLSIFQKDSSAWTYFNQQIDQISNSYTIQYDQQRRAYATLDSTKILLLDGHGRMVYSILKTHKEYYPQRLLQLVLPDICHSAYKWHRLLLNVTNISHHGNYGNDSDAGYMSCNNVHSYNHTSCSTEDDPNINCGGNIIHMFNIVKQQKEWLLHGLVYFNFCAVPVVEHYNSVPGVIIPIQYNKIDFDDYDKINVMIGFGTRGKYQEVLETCNLAEIIPVYYPLQDRAVRYKYINTITASVSCILSTKVIINKLLLSRNEYNINRLNSFVKAFDIDQLASPDDCKLPRDTMRFDDSVIWDIKNKIYDATYIDDSIWTMQQSKQQQVAWFKYRIYGETLYQQTKRTSILDENKKQLELLQTTIQTTLIQLNKVKTVNDTLQTELGQMETKLKQMKTVNIGQQTKLEYNKLYDKIQVQKSNIRENKQTINKYNTKIDTATATCENITKVESRANYKQLKDMINGREAQKERQKLLPLKKRLKIPRQLIQCEQQIRSFMESIQYHMISLYEKYNKDIIFIGKRTNYYTIYRPKKKIDDDIEETKEETKQETKSNKRSKPYSDPDPDIEEPISKKPNKRMNNTFGGNYSDIDQLCHHCSTLMISH